MWICVKEQIKLLFEVLKLDECEKKGKRENVPKYKMFIWEKRLLVLELVEKISVHRTKALRRTWLLFDEWKTLLWKRNGKSFDKAFAVLIAM